VRAPLLACDRQSRLARLCVSGDLEPALHDAHRAAAWRLLGPACAATMHRCAVADAVEVGATLAAYQPQDDVRVLLDPAGHPFCLYLGK
jgi:hypothetical protein